MLSIHIEDDFWSVNVENMTNRMHQSAVSERKEPSRYYSGPGRNWGKFYNHFWPNFWLAYLWNCFNYLSPNIFLWVWLMLILTHHQKFTPKRIKSWVHSDSFRNIFQKCIKIGTVQISCHSPLLTLFQKDMLLTSTLFVPVVDETLRSSPLVQVLSADCN